jgi:hypothetical protein
VEIANEKEKKKGGITSIDTSYWPGDVFPIVKDYKLLGYWVADPTQTSTVLADSFFLPWEFVHFAIPGDAAFYRLDDFTKVQNRKREDMVEYGQSLLRAARRPFKRSKLMHDILAIARMTRSPLKRVFKFQTETSNPIKAITDLAMFKRTMEKVGGIDSANGNMTYEELVATMTQDIFLPIMKDGKGDYAFDKVGGDVDVTSIVDVEMFDNRLFMSLRTPKEFMNFGTGAGDRSTLLLKDIRYAKRINRLQSADKAGLHELLMIHFAAQGREVSPEDFAVNMRVQAFL